MRGSLLYDRNGLLRAWALLAAMAVGVLLIGACTAIGGWAGLTGVIVVMAVALTGVVSVADRYGAPETVAAATAEAPEPASSVESETESETDADSDSGPDPDTDTGSAQG
jgi:hypothetical protein